MRKPKRDKTDIRESGEVVYRDPPRIKIIALELCGMFDFDNYGNRHNTV